MSVPGRGLQQSAGPNLVTIEDVRNQSELFRGKCSSLMQETDKASKRMQNDNEKRLDQRIRNLEFVKKELERKLEEITEEIKVLIDLQGRVGKAFEASKEPLRVTILCLEERMKRPPTERVRDEVERELLKEMKVIEGVAALLNKVLEQITEQIRLNRSVQYRLEQDMREKLEAHNIDNSCAAMTIHYPNNLQNAGAAATSLAVTPKQWEYMANLNMVKTEQQRSNSLSLRAMVESLLEQTSADMRKQLQATAEAIQQNVQKIKTAKSQMEDQLAKMLLEYASQQRVREDLQESIAQNKHTLSLVKARLCLRHTRPGKEQCLDPAQSKLLAEVQQLTAHIDSLGEAATRSEEHQRALVRCQLELQENIEIKASALYIDEVICTQHREPIVIRKF